MARSLYIYLVTDFHFVPQAAFTVKHEMIRWLRGMPDGFDYGSLLYFRMRDGQPGKCETFSLSGDDLA